MRGRRNPDADIDLGLAISGALMKPGQTRTAQEIADFCGVKAHAIQKYEYSGLRKLRKRMLRGSLSVWKPKEVQTLLYV